MQAARIKKVQAILFSKSKLVLTKVEKDFLWSFVKQYSDS